MLSGEAINMESPPKAARPHHSPEGGMSPGFQPLLQVVAD
jgi:hypothetical protein